MQLDLLYSFFIVCMDRHKKIQVTNTQIYVCVCRVFFIQHEGKRAVTGITWLPWGEEERQRPGLICLSKASTQFLFPPLPQVTLSNNKEQQQQQNKKTE